MEELEACVENDNSSQWFTAFCYTRRLYGWYRLCLVMTTPRAFSTDKRLLRMTLLCIHGSYDGENLYFILFHVFFSVLKHPCV